MTFINPGDVIMVRKCTLSYRWTLNRRGPFLVKYIHKKWTWKVWITELSGEIPKMDTHCVPWVRADEVTVDRFLTNARRAVIGVSK